LPLKNAALVRWTGRGSVIDLRSSADYLLRASHIKARVRVEGGSIVVEGPGPVSVAAMLQNMPGVAWVAAGLAVGSLGEAAKASRLLAGVYLRRGQTFSVEAEGGGGALASDLGGMITSGILEFVKGAHVSIASPKVRFRAAFDGEKGVVGVEVKRGPGGVSMGREWATCLVSGGMHSSVVAWAALLMGHRVRLVHIMAGDEGLRSVARLYSELCRRVDPRGLRLEVIEGAGQSEELAKYLAKSSGKAFGGFHSTKGSVPIPFRGTVEAPLYLMPEEVYFSLFESLGVKAGETEAQWTSKPGSSFLIKAFDGWAEDVSAILDGLR
jgi:adenylyl- and sulfurtransferase ThiI